MMSGTARIRTPTRVTNLPFDLGTIFFCKYNSGFNFAILRRTTEKIKSNFGSF